MSRTRRIMSGTGIAYAHQAAIILLGLWLTPFLLARVGQRELGLWLVAFSMARVACSAKARARR